MTRKNEKNSSAPSYSVDSRKLSDLRSVGPASVKDLKLLGIESVEALKDQNSIELYERLCEITSTRHDPCVIDVFRTAIEQARNPILEARKRDWWYWTKIRKQSLR
jgi:hypothetical protein